MPRKKKDMGRAANGTGTIRRKTVTKNGKEYIYWEARCTVGYDPGTGKQIQRSITGKTQGEVAKRLKQMAVEVDRGTYQDPTRITVGQWLDIWQKEYLGSVKPLTALNYAQHITNHIKPAMGALKLETLNTPTIQRFYNELGQPHGDRPGLSPKTVKNIHGVLHKALQQAVKIGYLRYNPVDACELPRIVAKEIKPLDSEAMTAFIQAARGQRFEAVYLTMLFTGMRRGEVFGLTWDCVNLERGTIRICKQLQKVPNQRAGFCMAPTKNSRSRTITVAPYVVEVLKQHKAKQDQDRAEAGDIWQDNGFVFCNEIGEHLSPHTVYHNYKRLVESIGMPNARLHDLRHSYAVASLRAGDDIKTVQGNLGHATASFTLDVYGHITDEMKQASADRMQNYIRGILSVSPQ